MSKEEDVPACPSWTLVSSVVNAFPLCSPVSPVVNAFPQPPNVQITLTSNPRTTILSTTHKAMTKAPHSDVNSFKHKILPASDCSSKIFSRFPPNLMIPIDGGGNPPRSADSHFGNRWSSSPSWPPRFSFPQIEHSHKRNAARWSTRKPSAFLPAMTSPSSAKLDAATNSSSSTPAATGFTWKP